MTKIAGADGGVLTNSTKVKSTKNAVTLIYEGPYSALETMQPDQGSTSFSGLPQGFTVVDSQLAGDGKGGGTLTVHCIDYSSGGEISSIATKTTFRVDMVATTYDLQQHPKLKTAQGEIAMWLASDPSVQYAGSTGYSYTDANGDVQEIAADSLAFSFCDAYKAGIRTFNKYYPVIQKISIYKSLPGGSMSGNSTTGGTVSAFSANIGTWDSPPLTLSGYASTNWFKSDDRYVQLQNQTWQRTEEWTYTPDGSTGVHAWIYAASSGSGGSGGNS